MPRPLSELWKLNSERDRGISDFLKFYWELLLQKLLIAIIFRREEGGGGKQQPKN